MSVAQTILLESTITDRKFVITDPNSNLKGLEIESIDQNVNLGEIQLEKITEENAPRISTHITRLSDIFVAKKTISGELNIKLPLSEIPEGSNIFHIHLYRYGQATDMPNEFWGAVGHIASINDNIDELTLSISSNNLGGRYFIGVEFPAKAEYPAVSESLNKINSRAKISHNCNPVTNEKNKTGYPYMWQECVTKNKASQNITITVVGFSERRDGTRWNGVAIDTLVEWLVDAQENFKKLGLVDYKKNIAVYIGVIRVDETQYIPGITDEDIKKDVDCRNGTLGFVDPKDPSIIRLTDVQCAKENTLTAVDMRNTVVHEYLHNAQMKFLPKLSRKTKWLTEGTARWFEDFVYDKDNSYITKERHTGYRILEVGLNSIDSKNNFSRRPYQRFSFFKLVFEKCEKLSSLSNSMFGELYDISNISDDPTGIVNFSNKLVLSGCNFGDQLGVDSTSSLGAALLFYQYSTLFENRMSLLDSDEKFENDNFNFLPPKYTLNHYFQSVLDIKNSITDIKYIPAQSAHSFKISSNFGDLGDKQIAYLRIESSGNLIVSIIPDYLGFIGDAKIDVRDHDWFETDKQNTYLYEFNGVVPEVFATILNSSPSAIVKNVEITFHIVELESITIEPGSITKPSSTSTLLYKAMGRYPEELEPQDITQKVSWKSSAENIVSIDENTGLATFKGVVGSATITATIGDITSNESVITAVKNCTIDNNCNADDPNNSNCGQEPCPQTPSGSSSSSTGDPHLRTLDGFYYDFQGVGEFILAESRSDDFEIQVRTSQWNNYNVALNKAVAINVHGDLIGIYRKKTGIELYVNGQITALELGSIDLPNGGKIQRYDDTFDVIWADDTTLRCYITSFYINLTLYANQERQGKLVGLLGNFDGNGANEITSREGEVFEGEVSFTDFYQKFGHSWRITQEESLFIYAENETTETFTDRDFPSGIATPALLSDTDRQNARKLCEDEGLTGVVLNACILDIGVTGDASFAKAHALVETPESEIILVPPPTITIFHPQNQALITGDIIVKGKINTDNSVSKLTISINDGQAVNMSDYLVEKSFTYLLKQSEFQESINKIKLVVIDDLGNEGFERVFVNPPQLNESLVLYMPFNGNANDMSGNGHAPIVHQAVLTEDKHQSKKSAYRFNGSTSYIDTQIDRAQYTELTICAGYQYNGSIDDGYRSLFGGDSADFALTKHEGNSNIGVQDVNYVFDFSINTNAWDGEWHHLCYSNVAGVGKVYLDSALVGTANIGQGSGDIWIGKENQENVFPFDGVIDEVRIYDRALSSNEIETIFQSFNKQVNHITTGIGSVGDIDNDFQLILPNAGEEISSTIINRHPAWTPVTPGNWIGPLNGNQDGASGTFHYIYRFQLNQATGLHMIANWASDNQSIIKINGVTIVGLSGSFVSTQSFELIDFNMFTEGENILEVFTENAYGPTGFFMDASIVQVGE